MRHPGHIPPHSIPLPREALPLPIVSLREPPTCDALGVCQHPVQCSGRTCYLEIVTPAPAYSTALMRPADRPGPVERIDQRDPAIGTPFDEFTFWALCFAAYAAIFAVLGYLWGRHGDKIKAFIVNAWGLLA